MKIKDYLKKYLFESTWTGMGDEAGNSYPDDGSGIAGDDDRPPGNILMAPRYERGEYFNKLTPYILFGGMMKRVVGLGIGLKMLQVRTILITMMKHYYP